MPLPYKSCTFAALQYFKITVDTNPPPVHTCNKSTFNCILNLKCGIKWNGMGSKLGLIDKLWYGTVVQVMFCFQIGEMRTYFCFRSVLWNKQTIKKVGKWRVTISLYLQGANSNRSNICRSQSSILQITYPEDLQSTYMLKDDEACSQLFAYHFPLYYFSQDTTFYQLSTPLNHY